MNMSVSWLLLALGLLVTQAATSSGEQSRVIGAILDNTSRAGREAKVSIDMALDDIGNNTNQRFVTHIINSQGKPLLAALQARNLIRRKKVQAILGPQTWEEASLVVEVANQSYIPTLSLAGSTPKWATEKWPFLVQASVSRQDAQMKAVAAIVQSYNWRRVTLIYEEAFDSALDGIMPNLFEALRKGRAEISHLVPLPPLPSHSISKELKRLKEEQCRVFVVHTSLKLGVHLFAKAKTMQMMGKGYIWITTSTITDHVHSLEVSPISSMQGVVGIKTHFSETRPKFVDFRRRFRKRFSSEYPDEEYSEAGISAAEAYDAMWVLASALDQGKPQADVQQFLEKVSSIDFIGVAGGVRFLQRSLASSHVFGIVNVIGKNSRDVGFWSEGLGFSKSIDDKPIYNSSMQTLGPVIWPGEPWYTPRGWTHPTRTNSLRIGVPAEAMFKQFVNTSYDPVTRSYSCTGYSIQIFKETLARLPYNLSYHFIPFHGIYDSLVEQIYLNEFDAVVGDVAVIAERCEYADFTHTYTNSLLMMIVPAEARMPNAWLFMKPFTKDMWALIFVITIYNGFVVWLIERNHNSKLTGSAANQTGIMISLSFTTLFSLQGRRLHSNLSRLVMVVWLFVALIIIQSYTASLTSMLTVRKLEPTIADIKTLKANNATVGYGKGAFVAKYLVEVLGFKQSNLRNFSSPEDFANALKMRRITAGFLNGSYVKLLLAKYCKSFKVAGPSYKVGGFGFAFPRGSSVLADVNEALLNVFESGKLRQLEDSMIGSEKCVEVNSTDDDVSLSLDSFWILFLFTGSTTTCALVVYALGRLWIAYDSIKQRISNILSVMFNSIKQRISNILSVMFSNWEYQRRRICSKVCSTESPENPPVESSTDT